jgi:hypothetical protein
MNRPSGDQSTRLLSSLDSSRSWGVDPARLVSAAQKMLRFKEQNFGPAETDDHYLALAKRKKFAKAVMDWVAAIEPRDSSRRVPATP